MGTNLGYNCISSRAFQSRCLVSTNTHLPTRSSRVPHARSRSLQLPPFPSSCSSRVDLDLPAYVRTTTPPDLPSTTPPNWIPQRALRQTLRSPHFHRKRLSSTLWRWTLPSSTRSLPSSTRNLPSSTRNSTHSLSQVLTRPPRAALTLHHTLNLCLRGSVTAKVSH